MPDQAATTPDRAIAAMARHGVSAPTSSIEPLKILASLPACGAITAVLLC